MDFLGLDKRVSERKQALLGPDQFEGGNDKIGSINQSELNGSFSAAGVSYKDYEEGSIYDWAQYFKHHDFELIPQYQAEIKAGNLVYSACQDLNLNLSPEQFYLQKNDLLEQTNENFEYIYVDNRKELLCIELETCEPKLVYTAEDDIRSLQFRSDGLGFIVNKTNTVDIIQPTENGVFERVKLINTNSMQNHRIFISEYDENIIYLRTLQNVYKPEDGLEQIPINLDDYDDIETDKEIYCESIKKFELVNAETPSEIELNEIAEYSVYSN